MLNPVVSWDNQWIAAYHGKSESTWQEPREIGIYPRAGGAAVKTLPLQASEFDWTPLRWTPDNQAIGYIDQQGGVANLWLQPLDGARAANLRIFKAAGSSISSGRGTGGSLSSSALLLAKSSWCATDTEYYSERSSSKRNGIVVPW